MIYYEVIYEYIPREIGSQTMDRLYVWFVDYRVMIDMGFISRVDYLSRHRSWRSVTLGPSLWVSIYKEHIMCVLGCFYAGGLQRNWL